MSLESPNKTNEKPPETTPFHEGKAPGTDKTAPQTSSPESSSTSNILLSSADNNLYLTAKRNSTQEAPGLAPLEITDKISPKEKDKHAAKADKPSLIGELSAAVNSLTFPGLVPATAGAYNAFFGRQGAQTNRAGEFNFSSGTADWFNSAVQEAKKSLDYVLDATGGAKIDISQLFDSPTETKESSRRSARDRAGLTKDADGTIHYEAKEGPHAKADISKGNGHFEAGDTKIDQSRNKGPKDINAEVVNKDGSTIKYEQKKDGSAEISNSDSDFKVLRQDGKYSIVDSETGKTIMKFPSKGGLERFLDNSTLAVTQPGESLEQTAQRIQKEREKSGENKNKAILINDGEGNSLSIDPSGRTIKRFQNGDVEITHKHKHEDGKDHELKLLIKKGQNGDQFQVADENGKYKEVSREELRELLKGSDFGFDRDGKFCARQRRERSDKDPNGKADESQSDSDLKPLVTDEKIQVAPNTVIRRQDGKMIITDGDREVTVDKDSSSGQTIVSEKYKGEADRVTYIEKDGAVKTVDPKNEKDTISFDPSTNTVKAWDNIITPDNATLIDRDGNKTVIDNQGNFKTVDLDGNRIFQSDDNGIYLPNNTFIDSYGNVYDLAQEQQLEAAQEMVEKQAEIAAATVTSTVMSLIAQAGVIKAGAVSGLLGQIEQARSMCLMLGVDPPASLETARNNVLNFAGQINQEFAAQQKVYDQIGTINPHLAALIRASGASQNPDLAAQYAITNAGYGARPNG